MREKMKKSRETYNASMKKILTEEQYKKYEKLEKDREKNMRNRRPQGGNSQNGKGQRPQQK